WRRLVCVTTSPWLACHPSSAYEQRGKSDDERHGSHGDVAGDRWCGVDPAADHPRRDERPGTEDRYRPRDAVPALISGSQSAAERYENGAGDQIGERQRYQQREPHDPRRYRQVEPGQQHQAREDVRSPGFVGPLVLLAQRHYVWVPLDAD